ncbi:MAG TPA: ABC transporter permease, partial [Bryobacteraceae bacterium]|nr:ABC transporter permease [Bryobacteraceae bacterium]
MDEFWKDLRYTARMLAKKPGFTVIAVATLALGIGVNTAMFSIVNGVLLQPLAFPQSDRLMTLYENRAAFPNASISYPNYLDWKRTNQCFRSLSAFRPQDFTVFARGRGERLKGEMVSAGFFPTLGVQPLVGRELDAQEDHLGGKPEVLISEGLWKRMFGGSRSVVGRVIRMNGDDYTVVG